MDASAICHRDVLDRKGAFPFMRRPTILGHEVAGTVESVGAGVVDWSPGARLSARESSGDRVVTLHWSPCGVCGACREGRTTHCADARATFFGLTVDGGYAEYVANRAGAFARVPAGWRAVEAAPVICTYGTVWHGVVSRGRLRAGETLLVTGASGGVGSAAVQLAHAMGARVVALTSSQEKAAHCRALGADEVLVATPEALAAEPNLLAKRTGGVDIVLETVGEPTFLAALR